VYHPRQAGAKYRFGRSPVWAGLSYQYFTTQVSFEAPPETPGLPDFQRDSRIGGLTPTLTYDTRDTIFTPSRGTYVEAGASLWAEALGGDDDFQTGYLVAMQYVPLHPKLDLGVRGEGITWIDLDRFEKQRSVTAGGTGFRYELARRYKLHMGVDVAFGEDGTAFYVQFGNAWMRP
jgi:outer membrane protein assembly factor BamA